FYRLRRLRVLPSFPTRRSSDLLEVEDVVLVAHVEPIEEALLDVRCGVVDVDRDGLATIVRERIDGLENARSVATVRDVLELLVLDRKSTRLNSSHVKISYAVFC